MRVTNGGGQFPRWSSDGRTLYYWSRENLDVDTLYAAQVRTEPPFAVLNREIVSYGAYTPEHWDLHPDGTRFLVLGVKSDTIPPGQDERFHVIVGFFEELKRLVPSS
jgi:hypothetical protein